MLKQRVNSKYMLVATDKRVCGSQTPSLLIFHIISKWEHKDDSNMFKVYASSQLLLTGDFIASSLNPGSVF